MLNVDNEEELLRKVEYLRDIEQIALECICDVRTTDDIVCNNGLVQRTVDHCTFGIMESMINAEFDRE